jgi:hypothetical protein
MTTPRVKYSIEILFMVFLFLFFLENSQVLTVDTPKNHPKKINLNYLRKLNLAAKMSISFFIIFRLIFCFHHFKEDYHVILGQN